MNFSLGNKEAILNSSDKYAYSKVGDVMNLKGFGSFLQANVLSAFGQRYIAPRYGKLTITAPTAAELGIGASEINVPVKAHIRVNTTRHSSEWAVDFIKRGRPFIFEIVVNGGVSSTVVAAKLAEAFVEYEAKFNLADRGLPFTWVDNADGTIDLTLKDPYLSFQKTVEFLKDKAIYGVKAVTTSSLDSGLNVNGIQTTSTTLVLDSTAGLRVGDKFYLPSDATTILEIASVNSATNLTLVAAFTVSTADLEALILDYQPQEPTFDGKYLEENVRMSTPYTSDSYGISPDEKPYITGAYTQITFKVKSGFENGIDGNYAAHNFMGTTVDEKTGDKIHTFTVYCLEGSDLFDTGGTVDSILDHLIGGTPTIATFLLANGTPAADVAAFIA